MKICMAKCEREREEEVDGWSKRVENGQREGVYVCVRGYEAVHFTESAPLMSGSVAKEEREKVEEQILHRFGKSNAISIVKFQSKFLDLYPFCSQTS